MKDDPEFLEARPIIASNRTGRLVVVAGNQRLRAAQSLAMETVPVIIVNLSEEKEKLWSLKDNLHQGDWDWDALAEFDEMLLTDAGFNSEELDKIFEDDPTEEQWSLEAELDKLNIETITVQKGDVYDLDGSRLCCGDSTVEADVFRLMGDEKADMVMTDPPYRLDYLQGKTRHGDATVGFGTRRIVAILRPNPCQRTSQIFGCQTSQRCRRKISRLSATSLGKTSERFGMRWRSGGR